jgi:acetyl-CoA carboxylase alpha subunit
MLGADLTLRDIRGNDALADARRQKRIVVLNYINTVISDTVIKHYCGNFAEGLLDKGIYQAIGNFHKRFSDLYIKVTIPSMTYQDRLSNLKQDSK